MISQVLYWHCKNCILGIVDDDILQATYVEGFRFNEGIKNVARD